MASTGAPLNMSKELAKLKHERKNQAMRKLPSNATIERRPLHHPPIASPFAGAQVHKVVYVSRRTPVMSAVKRVKKLLVHIEKRALQSVDMLHQNEHESYTKLSEASDKIGKSPEEVLVKASGRAMEQALRIGEWFRNREREMLCNVEVRTGSVAAIDDIVENEGYEPDDVLSDQEKTTLEGGDTTMELLGRLDEGALTAEKSDTVDKAAGEDGILKRKRRKRKRNTYEDEKDLPEARLRWVKTVEIAISLKA